jgi:diguanylate cyclase (GGDEF)-like protein
LRNRRFLEARLAEEMARVRRHGGALSLMLLDLDHFKAINDSRGHDVGDAMLRRLARLVLEEVRETDTAARPAGDEFAILLPETSVSDAATLGERLRWRARQRLDGATLSIGVAVFLPEAHASPRDFFRAVDQALYEAKAAGRDAIRVA